MTCSTTRATATPYVNKNWIQLNLMTWSSGWGLADTDWLQLPALAHLSLTQGACVSDKCMSSKPLAMHVFEVDHWSTADISDSSCLGNPLMYSLPGHRFICGIWHSYWQSLQLLASKLRKVYFRTRLLCVTCSLKSTSVISTVSGRHGTVLVSVKT